MDHGDGRFASRFRPEYTPDSIPRVAGLCVKCLRTMWTNLGDQGRKGMVTVSADGLHCNSCRRYMRETGGLDPREHRGSPAERIPAELPESDRSWRDNPDRRCLDVGAEVFEPDPEDLSDALIADLHTVWDNRRYAAVNVCGDCPVMRQCRAAAQERGYEGLWGGRFFTVDEWVDLVTGAKGPTINANARTRQKLLAALERAGYTEDGEPIPAETDAA